MFNASEILGTGSVRESRYCAWYREFDSSKFERLFEAAVADGVPYGYVVNARIGGELIPAVDFCKYNDYKNRADLRNPDERRNFLEFCRRRIGYLKGLTGKNIK